MAKDRDKVEPKEADQRFVRRDEQGQFTEEQEDIGHSLSSDRKRDATSKAERGQGDRGDRGRSK